ncbi:CoA transferase [Streptomyces sp. B6B3]|uniref:CoA transferase n=1 Tax=Streptomyces sp. B6B3 TaxID=3153570 RepID=UPI00325D7696
MGTLDGYRVVDLTITRAGPLAAARLGALGADVARAEQPEDDRGRALVLDLVSRADVLLHHGGRAGRAGLDYPAVRAVNPGIVYVAAPGPDAGSDAGPDAGPDDAATAYAVVEEVLAALLHRAGTGEGRLVTVRRDDEAVVARARELSPDAAGAGPYGVFPTRDGQLALALPPLDALGDALGLPELGGRGGHRTGHSCRDEITALVRLRLPRRTTAEWLERCARHGIPARPVTAAGAANGAANGTDGRHENLTELGPPGRRARLAEGPLGAWEEAS